MIPSIALACVAGVMAFANGANDNFKGVATLHGSRALSYRQALLWATVTTLAGSSTALLLARGLVSRFSGKGLVADSIAADPAFLLAAGAAAAGTVLLATRLGFPVSTTHALMGGLMGAGVALAGAGQVSLATLGAGFVLPLLASPLMALVLAAAIQAGLRGLAGRLGIAGGTCLCVGREPAVGLGSAGTVSLGSRVAVALDRIDRCEDRYGGRIFGLDARSALDRAHGLSSGAVSFARGLNDTPKIAALLVAADWFAIPGSVLLVGLAIAVGGLLGAARVARTMSFEITEMTPAQGFSANLATAALVGLASPLGLPVSTTHVSCGALFGIGAASRETRWRTVGEILVAWVTTVPVAAVLAMALALAARPVSGL